MLVLVLLLSVLYYQKTTQIIHSKISDLAEKNISQTVGLFDLLLQGYDSITKSLNSNYEMLRLIQDRDTNKDQAVSIINERTITNILGAIYYSRDDIVGIHVITNAGKNYNYERGFDSVIDTNYSSSEWYQKLQDSSGEMVWLGLFQGSVINRFQKDQLFVFGRKLYDLTDHRVIGVMLIETNPQPILAALSNVTISPNSRVYIVDRENRMIASTAEEKVIPPSFSGLPRPQSDEIIVDDRTDQLIVAAKAKMSDWTVLGLTPKGDINAEVVKTREYLYVVIVVLVILSTALASLISRNIASPLKLLIREMKQVEMGNFKGSVTVKSFEEINSLVSSFNRMVNRMEELIERITLSSMSEKNAELQALQSQVNPHFLYNTLDMIYWMLDERENDRLGKVILALSHMFRYSSDWQEASKTTLRQELDQMRHYITIIESRLEGRVSTDIQIDPDVLDVILPKMTLQPIIENAVKYGLEPLREPGILRVRTEVHEQELHIIIQDNGVGIEESTLTEMQELLRADTAEAGGLVASMKMEQQTAASSVQAAGPSVKTRRGIGLTNVHRRIALMFGDAYGLRIHSNQGEGTTVIIAMPLPRKGM
ncbi:sensor histidine kinase [Paenibacillus alginolyticus]|uniref:histidine kinase n=2 Tax=Paenibacillus alginolyticus TaxID=59839 RepID=A0ABT4GCL5_9BACL|nr:sensor histidine kinase [Paenibacillus alginolyticus]MCY9664054.1 sensor histidine kinase [Paenibacillus alginolyticus]MCY9693864.1 sensor histidine kinase [Paenibacillus alginolyticus]MEC0145115.1 sensor histidine kinase [Paenibacillus alginolyticus]